MASPSNEQENLQTSIFSIEASKDLRSPAMRKGTAFAVKVEGSSSTYLMTCCAVVEQSGATSSSKLTCKRFDQSLQGEKHPINPDSEESLKKEEFCFIPFESPSNLKLISADKLYDEGEMMSPKSACKSFTFSGNSFITMTWEFIDDENTYALTKNDPDVGLAPRSFRGSPVVSIDDLGTVIGVVACSSNEDLELLFLKENALREIEEQIKARCSDDTTDVIDSPSRPRVRGPPLSSHQLQNTHPEDTGTNAQTSSAGLVRLLSNVAVQETTQDKRQTSSHKGKREEKRCIWDKLVPSVKNHESLMKQLKLHLDPKRKLGGDYRSLASAFGNDLNYTWFLESTPSPVEQLIQDYRPTVRMLKDALNSDVVKREDVAHKVEKWVKNEGCNCEICFDIR